MYTLNYPGDKIGDPFTVLETALGAAPPKPMKQTLRRLYRRYLSQGGAACRMTAVKHFRVTYGADLKAAYKKTYDGKPLHWLRTELLAVAGNRCPSCGGARPVELDHHLAQTAFPEFAIFPLNLVAMCGPCNRHKSAMGGKSIAKAFIHPYLDQIPQVAFYTAAVAREGSSYVVTFAFSAAAIPDGTLAARMAHQLDRIDLNGALSSEVSELLNELALRIELEIVSRMAV